MGCDLKPYTAEFSFSHHRFEGACHVVAIGGSLEGYGKLTHWSCYLGCEANFSTVELEVFELGGFGGSAQSAGIVFSID